LRVAIMCVFYVEFLVRFIIFLFETVGGVDVRSCRFFIRRFIFFAAPLARSSNRARIPFSEPY
jgi:hypothetical protein